MNSYCEWKNELSSDMTILNPNAHYRPFRTTFLAQDAISNQEVFGYKNDIDHIERNFRLRQKQMKQKSTANNEKYQSKLSDDRDFPLTYRQVSLTPDSSKLKKVKEMVVNMLIKDSPTIEQRLYNNHADFRKQPSIYAYKINDDAIKSTNVINVEEGESVRIISKPIFLNNEESYDDNDICHARNGLRRIIMPNSSRYQVQSPSYSMFRSTPPISHTSAYQQYARAPTSFYHSSESQSIPSNYQHTGNTQIPITHANQNTIPIHSFSGSDSNEYVSVPQMSNDNTFNAHRNVSSNQHGNGLHEYVSNKNYNTLQNHVTHLDESALTASALRSAYRQPDTISIPNNSSPPHF